MTFKSNSILTFFCAGLSLSCFGATDQVSPSSDAVVLIVNGVKFTLGDIEKKNPNALSKPRNTFYEAEKKAFTKFADDYILDRQAEKEHLTVDQLLDKHVNKAIAADPSEDAMHVYYEGLETKEPYESVRKDIVDHIREIRTNKARTEYLQALHNQAKIEVLVRQPRASIALADAAMNGSPNVPVTIVEYADYECPYCQKAEPTIQTVLAEYKGKVVLAYKDTPLPMHAHAEKASEAAHCAGLQGKYFEFHDLIYTNKQLEIPQLKADARALKLDGEAFDKCLDSGAEAAAVKAQLTEGASLGLEGTPSFYVNGRFVSGNLALSDWRKLMDEEIASAQTKPAETAQRR